jgi:hypothetical protein
MMCFDLSGFAPCSVKVWFRLRIWNIWGDYGLFRNGNILPLEFCDYSSISSMLAGEIACFRRGHLRGRETIVDPMNFVRSQISKERSPMIVCLFRCLIWYWGGEWMPVRKPMEEWKSSLRSSGNFAFIFIRQFNYSHPGDRLLRSFRQISFWDDSPDKQECARNFATPIPRDLWLVGRETKSEFTGWSLLGFGHSSGHCQVRSFPSSHPIHEASRWRKGQLNLSKVPVWRFQLAVNSLCFKSVHLKKRKGGFRWWNDLRVKSSTCWNSLMRFLHESIRSRLLHIKCQHPEYW